MILSRGYGRRPGAPVELVSDGGAPRLPAEQAGDEPLLLARRLPGVAVVVGADRLRGGPVGGRASSGRTSCCSTMASSSGGS